MTPTDIILSLLEEQQTTNGLLREMLAAHKAKIEQMARWQKANPDLSTACHAAAHKLNDAQNEFFGRMAEDIEDADFDSEFNLMEFLDKYGQRFAQLSTVTATLAAMGQPTQAG